MILLASADPPDTTFDQVLFSKRKMMRREVGWVSVSTRPLSHLSKPTNKCVSHYVSCEKVPTHFDCFCIDHTAATRWHSLSRVIFELQNVKYFTSLYQPPKHLVILLHYIPPRVENLFRRLTHLRHHFSV